MNIPSCQDCKYYYEPDTCFSAEADTWGDPKESLASFQRKQGWFGKWYYNACGKEGRYFKKREDEKLKEGSMEETKESQETTYEVGDVIVLNDIPIIFLLRKLKDWWVVGRNANKIGETYEIKRIELWSFNTLSTYASLLDQVYPNQAVVAKGAILDSLDTLRRELGIED